MFVADGVFDYMEINGASYQEVVPISHESFKKIQLKLYSKITVYSETSAAALERLRYI